MFGREPRLPIDLILSEDLGGDQRTHTEYARRWEEQMKEAYDIAYKKSALRKEKDCERRGRKPSLVNLEVEDRVLIKNVVERGGPGKLRSFWEQDIYVVKERKGGPDGVVYAVQKEHEPRGKLRVVHRNMLLPISPLFQLQD